MSTSPGAFPVRSVPAEDFDSFVAVDGLAFGLTVDADSVEAERGVHEPDRAIAAYDGTAMVGIAAAYSLDLTVPGAVVPAAGVTWVGVLPTHRRRGVMRSLITHQLDQVREAGREPVATLWASEPAIYGRFGYGRASYHYSVAVPRGTGALLPDAPHDPAMRLRLVPAEDWKLVADVYAAEAARRPGMLARDERWHRRAVIDYPGHRNGRSELRCLVAEDASGVRGYARYTTKQDWSKGFADGDVDVREIVALDPAAHAGLLRHLFDVDLMGTTRLWNVPVDDPLLHWLSDPRRAQPKRSDSLYIRIVDLPRALEARSYTIPVDAVLEVADPLIPANAGRWRLTVSGDGSARVQPSHEPPDAIVPVLDLGAAYLGGTALVELEAAGRVREVTPGCLPQLSLAFSASPEPWCPVVF